MMLQKEEHAGNMYDINIKHANDRKMNTMVFILESHACGSSQEWRLMYGTLGSESGLYSTWAKEEAKQHHSLQKSSL